MMSVCWQGQFVLLRFIQTHAVEVAQFGDIAFRDGDKAVRRGIQGGEAPLLLARMRVGKFIKAGNISRGFLRSRKSVRNLRGIFFEKKAVIQDLQKRKGEIKYE